MIDSLITEMPDYDEGWLLSLETAQYLTLFLILALLIGGWLFTRPGRIRKELMVFIFHSHSETCT